MDNLVKVEGELVVVDGTGSAREFYEEQFIIDGSIKTVEEARSLIRKGLITDKLRRTVNGFKSVRTMQVVSIEPTEEKAEESELTKIMLKAIKLGCVPENIGNYKRPDHKQKALERAIENYEARKAAQQRNNNVKDLGVVED